MNQITTDIKTLLEEADIGTDSSGIWLVFENFEPPAPKQCITIYDTGSEVKYTQGLGRTQLELSGFQIRIRGFNPGECKTQMEAVRTAIEHLGYMSINSLIYHDIVKTSGPFDLGYDPKNLSVLVCSFKAYRS